MNELSFTELQRRVKNWHYERDLIAGSDDKTQGLYVLAEAGELADSILKQKDIKDDIGDILVVLINICERNDTSLRECLAAAYDDIKNRQGKKIDGVFVKND